MGRGSPERLKRRKVSDLTNASDDDSVDSCNSDSADSVDGLDFTEDADSSPIDDFEMEEMEIPGSPQRDRGRTQRPTTMSCKGRRSQSNVDEVEAASSPFALEGRRGRGRTHPPAPGGHRGRIRSTRGCLGSDGFPVDAAGWKSEGDSDYLPRPLPQFLPKRRPGVQPPLTEYVDSPSPSKLFKMYFDKAAIKTLCANTNRNAEKNIAAGKKFKWTELTEPELYQYFGLSLYMGILKLPKIQDYWRFNSLFHVPYPQRVMSRRRFLAITRNIHLSDPSMDAINDSKKGTDNYDCLHRIRPLYDSLRVACKSIYQPQQNLSVDERIIAIKARIGLKEKMKSKDTTWGIKLVVLLDNTGYAVDFNIYTGMSALPTGKGLSFEAVMSLMKNNFLGPGYHLYCDNYYTSPLLFRHLYALGFGACGAFRDTRMGVPKTKTNALMKNSPRGTIRWIRDGALLFVKWMDTWEVSVCSTLHTAFSGDTVRRVCKVEGKERAVEVPVPSAVKDYRQVMEELNLSSQRACAYSSWRKSKKWYITVLHHLVDIAVANSFLLHKELCERLHQQPMTQQAFREQLTAELCGVPSKPIPQSYQHIPVSIVQGATGTYKATQGRRKCRVCGKCTPFMCEACKVPLCVIVDRNCHKTFHTTTGAEKH